MLNEQTQALISAEDLFCLLDDPNLIILYAGQPHPLQGNDTPCGFLPHARWFDFSHTICDLKSTIPNTMPSSAVFEDCMQALGVNSNSKIVVYDAHELFYAPRAWWMLKAMGHQQVQVLNGGLKARQDKGYAMQAGLALQGERAGGDFRAKSADNYFVDTDTVLNRISDQQTQILDARSDIRFHGKEPETRQGVRAGHIPTSKNLHYARCLQQGKLKPKPALAALFSSVIDNKQTQLIMSCGSGVTACLLALVAYELGYENIRVYDGSWTEWGADPNLPIKPDAL